MLNRANNVIGHECYKRNMYADWNQIASILSNITRYYRLTNIFAWQTNYRYRVNRLFSIFIQYRTHLYAWCVLPSTTVKLAPHNEGRHIDVSWNKDWFFSRNKVIANPLHLFCSCRSESHRLRMTERNWLWVLSYFVHFVADDSVAPNLYGLPPPQSLLLIRSQSLSTR